MGMGEDDRKRDLDRSCLNLGRRLSRGTSELFEALFVFPKLKHRWTL
jgi:hypothetical protein